MLASPMPFSSFREVLVETGHLAFSLNVQKDSWECSRRFPGMLEKISVNAREDSGESNFRFICEFLLIFLIKFCY